MSTQERQHPRYAHEAAVTFHVGADQLLGRTRNVSRGGLCSSIAGAVKAGATVDVDIQLVFEEGTTSEALRLPMRVAWCTPLDEAFQVGMSFLPLDAEQAEYLGLFLKYLDDGGQRERPFAKAANLDDRFG